MDNGGNLLHGLSYWDACSLVALLGLLACDSAYAYQSASLAAKLADQMVEEKRKRFS